MTDQTIEQEIQAKGLTAPQPTRQPLTNDEIDVLWAKEQTKPFKSHGETRMDFARAVEAAHGIGGNHG